MINNYKIIVILQMLWKSIVFFFRQETLCPLRKRVLVQFTTVWDALGPNLQLPEELNEDDQEPQVLSQRIRQKPSV